MFRKYVEITSEGDFVVHEDTSAVIDGADLFTLVTANVGYLTPLLGPRTVGYLQNSRVLVLTWMNQLAYTAKVTVGEVRPEGSMILVPSFSADRGVISPIPLTVCAPEGMSFLFGALVDEATFYLALIDHSTGRLCHPGVPNVFESGAICTGLEKFPCFSAARGLQGYLDEALQAMLSAEWNGDLLDRNPAIAKFLRFSRETGQTLPVPRDSALLQELQSVQVTDPMLNQAALAMFKKGSYL